MAAQENGRVRFGPFELNIRTEELQRDGQRIKLQSQPVHVLAALLENPGALVTREELQHRIWPQDTFVDFEQSLNTSVRKLRQALGDDPDEPHYIETLPRRGYRFIAPVDGHGPQPYADFVPPAQPPADTHAPLDDAQSRRLFLGMYLAGIAGLIALVLVVIVFIRSRHGPPAEVARLLSTMPGPYACPAFSPDGERIAFLHSGPDANMSDIYLQSIPDNSLLKLTTQPGQYGCPRFSPDGRYLGFRQNKEGEAGIYVMPTLGGSVGKLASVHFLEGGFDWSPDGKNLIYSDDDRTEQKRSLHKLDLATLQDSLIVSGDLDIDTALYSPDGKWIALGLGSGIAVVPAGGGKLREFPKSNNCGFAWSADGREIVFTRHLDGPTPIVRLPIAERQPRSQPGNISSGSLCSVAISPKHNRLAYVVQSGETGNICRMDLPTANNPRPGPPRVLIETTSKEEAGQISPDGKHIVFQSERTGQREIWLANSDGSNQLQLTHSDDCSCTGTPRWSPDGRWISYGDDGVHVVSANGGTPRKLNTCIGVASWSHDGKSLYCNGPPKVGENQIWRVWLETGDAHQVTRNGGFNAFESSDGQYLYLSKRKTSGVYRVPVEGGPELKIMDGPEVGAWAYWALEDDGIYSIVRNPDPNSADRNWLEFFDFTSKRSTRIATIRQTLSFASPGFAVSPDRSWMLFSGGEKSRNERLMMIDNFQ